jgi:hydroxyquinol 1,2-dioxygenase
MRPAHLHLMVQAGGHRTLVTHVFPQGDPYAGADPVFGFRESLVVDVVEHDAGEGTPNGRKVSGSWTSVHFDIALGPERDDG